MGDHVTACYFKSALQAVQILTSNNTDNLIFFVFGTQVVLIEPALFFVQAFRFPPKVERHAY